MRTFLFVFFAATLVAGCDTAGHSESASAYIVTLDARGAQSGDVYFSLPPIDQGSALTVSTLAGDDRLSLHARRDPDGYDLGLDTGRLHPESVRVSYLSDGKLIGYALPALNDSLLFEGGMADEEPTSVHWEKDGDRWILVYDFTLTPTGSTLLTTESGTALEVTHIAFTISGIDAPAPHAVEFEAPRPLTIRGKTLGQPLAVSVGELN